MGELRILTRRLKMKNIIKSRKGSEMTIGKIVIIVLALLVLILLALGFSMGWKNLWDKITNFSGGSSTIDSVKQSCQIACDSNSKVAYCNENRTYKNTSKGIQYGLCATDPNIIPDGGCPGITC